MPCVVRLVAPSPYVNVGTTVLFQSWNLACMLTLDVLLSQQRSRPKHLTACFSRCCIVNAAVLVYEIVTPKYCAVVSMGICVDPSAHGMLRCRLSWCQQVYCCKTALDAEPRKVNSTVHFSGFTFSPKAFRRSRSWPMQRRCLSRSALQFMGQAMLKSSAKAVTKSRNHCCPVVLCSCWKSS